MKIINQTKNIILAEEVTMADRPFPRMKGLLGRKGLRPDEALVLNPCNSVHTFFMRFPIDVLFVSKENRVIKALPYLKPFRLSPIYYKSAFAVELSAGIIQSTSTSAGDLLSIQERF